MAAAAFVGMTEAEFWKTSPAFLRARLRAKTDEQRVQMEVIRAHAYTTVMPHIQRRITIQKFWPLPWDKTTAKAIPKLDEEALKRFEAGGALDNFIMQQLANGTKRS